VRLPRDGGERIIARDRYRNKILLHHNLTGEQPHEMYDLQTDGRVLLDSRLARELANALIDFANTVDMRGL
jgi:hypothetical protein